MTVDPVDTASQSDPFRYCPLCSEPLRPYQDEGRRRQRCPRCGWIRYRNPTVGVALIVLDGRRVLLGKRRSGRWCIPCGHVEWDEDIREAAQREALEELGVHISLGEIYAAHSNFHDPTQHTVGVWFRAEIDEPDALVAGGDLQTLGFFRIHELPELAFPTDRMVLERLQLEL